MGIAARAIGIESIRETQAAITAAARSAAIVPLPRRRPVGRAGTMISAGVIDDLDQNTEVRNWKWYGEPGKIGLAGKMLRDPHVRQSVNAVSSPLRAADWVFRPGDKSELAREVADYCQWCIVERLPWDLYLKRIIGNYTTYGFALEEMTDDIQPIPRDRFPLHPGGGVGLIPTGLYDRPAWTVSRWIQSESNPAQLKAIEQWVQGSDVEEGGTVTIDASRLLRWTYDQDGANFEGLAPLRSAYGVWKLKQAFLTLLAIALERFSVGVPVMTASEDASDEDLDAAQVALEELRAHEKAYILMPNGFTLTIEGAGESDAENIMRAIEMCDKAIAFNVGAGYTLLGLTGKSGSYALGSTLESHYHLATEGHAAFFASVWNHGADGWSPVRRIVEHNYGPDAPMPRLEARNLPTKDWAEVIKLAGFAVQAGLITPDAPTEDRIRSILQLDPLDESTIRERKASDPVRDDGSVMEPGQIDQSGDDSQDDDTIDQDTEEAMG